MKKVARMLRGHRALLLNWFGAKGHLSSGSVEGLNTKAKLTIRKAFGFRDQLQFWWSRGLLCGHAVVMPNQGPSIILVVALLIGTPSLSLNQGRQGQPLV